MFCLKVFSDFFSDSLLFFRCFIRVCSLVRDCLKLRVFLWVIGGVLVRCIKFCDISRGVGVG